MNEQLLLPYFIASILCIAMPGTDSLGTLSIGITNGRKPAMAYATGVGIGCMTHTLWACIGIAAIVAASQTLFTTIKWIGAIYLFYVGVQAITQAKHNGLIPNDSDTKTTAHTVGQTIAQTVAKTVAKTVKQTPPEQTSSKRIGQGFLSNALNPKVMLFFLAFLPQFVDTRPGAFPVWSQMAIFGSIFAVMTGFSYMALAWASGSAGLWIRARPAMLVWINRIAGFLFIALAVRLILSEKDLTRIR